MGGTTFLTFQRGDDPHTAYVQAVADAQWMHGHGGYSGTIAEKQGYVLVGLPTGFTAASLFATLQDYWLEDDDLIGRVDDRWSRKAKRATEKLRKAVGRREADRMFGVFDDKWGPALAVEVRPRTAEAKRAGGTGKRVFAFMGWAST